MMIETKRTHAHTHLDEDTTIEQAARLKRWLMFLPTFLFGAQRSETGRLLAIASIAVGVYGLTIVATQQLSPAGLNMRLELLRWCVVAGVIYWLAAIGSYTARVKKNLSESNAKLQDTVRRIQDLAMRDALTQVPNRRYLAEVLRHEAARSARAAAPFCVCMIDIDFFKRINDRLGHHVGDEVLRHFACNVARETRESDFFGRYGGEEFLLILTHTVIDGAKIRAERLRQSTERMDFPLPRARPQITISIGIALHTPGTDVEETVKRADDALYRAKSAGRNCVAASDG